MSKRMTPADVVIQAFGGVCRTAREIGKNPSYVSGWRRARGKGGHAGEIPGAETRRAVLEKAKELGLDLTGDDLILGRKIG